MVVSKYSLDNYKTLKIRIGAIMKDPEMLGLVPGHLTTKTMYKNAVKKLPFIIKYVPDLYKTKEMCN